jgi:hypothetical protein
MKKAVIFALFFSLLFIPLLVEAQAPTPPDVPTLGPVIFCSAGDSMNFVKITAPVNQTVYANPVQLTFATQMMTMFGHSYNVGYSLDDNKVNSTGALSSSYTNEGTGASYVYETARAGSLSLPILSEGSHIVTVYAGYQYLGDINPRSERFEVYAYSTVEFAVGNPESSSPTPTQTLSPSPLPTFSSKPTVILSQVSSDYLSNQTYLIAIAGVIVIVIVALALLVYFKKRKST